MKELGLEQNRVRSEAPGERLPYEEEDEEHKEEKELRKD